MKRIHSSEFLATSFMQHSQIPYEELVASSIHNQCHTLFEHTTKCVTTRREPLHEAVSITVEIFTVSKEEYDVLVKMKHFFNRHANSEALELDEVANLIGLAHEWYDRVLEAEKDNL